MRVLILDKLGIGDDKGVKLRNSEQPSEKAVKKILKDALFSTLTN
jgi:hypothetical protein